MYSAPTPDRPTHVNRYIGGRDGIGSVANRVADGVGDIPLRP